MESVRKKQIGSVSRDESTFTLIVGSESGDRMPVLAKTQIIESSVQPELTGKCDLLSMSPAINISVVSSP